MVITFGEYAMEFSIMVNLSKFKLFHGMLASPVPNIMLGDEVIEAVQFERYLGNRLYADIYRHDVENW